MEEQTKTPELEDLSDANLDMDRPAREIFLHDLEAINSRRIRANRLYYTHYTQGVLRDIDNINERELLLKAYGCRNYSIRKKAGQKLGYSGARILLREARADLATTGRYLFKKNHMLGLGVAIPPIAGSMLLAGLAVSQGGNEQGVLTCGVVGFILGAPFSLPFIMKLIDNSGYYERDD